MWDKTWRNMVQRRAEAHRGIEAGFLRLSPARLADRGTRDVRLSLSCERQHDPLPSGHPPRAVENCAAAATVRGAVAAMEHARDRMTAQLPELQRQALEDWPKRTGVGPQDGDRFDTTWHQLAAQQDVLTRAAARLQGTVQTADDVCAAVVGPLNVRGPGRPAPVRVRPGPAAKPHLHYEVGETSAEMGQDHADPFPGVDLARRSGVRGVALHNAGDTRVRGTAPMQ